MPAAIAANCWLEVAYPWMASHRFFVFVISRRKPRSNHHWLMLATKLTLGLDHSLAQKQNVSAIFLRHPIAIVIFCAQNRVSFLRAVL